MITLPKFEEPPLVVTGAVVFPEGKWNVEVIDGSVHATSDDGRSLSFGTGWIIATNSNPHPIRSQKEQERPAPPASGAT